MSSRGMWVRVPTKQGHFRSAKVRRLVVAVRWRGKVYEYNYPAGTVIELRRYER